MNRFHILSALTGLCLLLALPDDMRAEATKLPVRLAVKPSKSARKDVPVSIALDGLYERRAKLQLSEIRGNKKKAIPSQWDATGPHKLWWIMDGKTPAGEERRYVLETVADHEPAVSTMSVDRTDAYLEIRRRDTKILRYNTNVTPLPPGADPKYKRSGYINPVWTPSGQVVTDRAKNYLHQLGVWLAYVGTSFEGRAPNFWDLLNGRATVRFSGMQHKAGGPVFAEFRVVQDHIDLADPGSPKVALKETWNVRAWNVGTSEGYSLYDIATTISCAGPSHVTVKKHAWGGMAIRGAPEWYGEKCKFLTSAGKTRSKANHTRVRWCNISGSTKGVWSGMTVMSHPDNLRHPEPVRVNETIPYFCFTGSYLGDFDITPDKPLVLRYRFLVHDGEVRADSADRLWKDFATPPAAAIVAE